MNRSQHDHVPALSFYLFGNFAVHSAIGTRALDIAKKERWLLALLVLRNGAAVERDWLAETFWQDAAPERALQYLRRSLMNLRDALGDEAWRLQQVKPRSIRMDLAGAWVDVSEFDLLVKHRDEHSLIRAVDLNSGSLLEPCQEEWAYAERIQRELAYQDALSQLVEMSVDRNDHAAAIQYSRKLIAADPFREPAHRSLMTSLAASGSHAAAIQAYRDLRLRLREEMNSDAAPETAAIFESIKRSARESLRQPILAQSKQLPVQTATTVNERPALPRPLTRIIGRDQEIEEILSRLKTCRLISLVGAGGVGKTRLSLEVVSLQASAYKDGVAFADLAPIVDGDLVPRVVLQSMGLPEDGLSLPMDALCRVMKNQEVLLVLDNCEHVSDACAMLAQRLSSQCHSVRILATSRGPLNVTGEVVVRVPSLEAPPALPSGLSAVMVKDEVASNLDYPSVQLFIERVQNSFPEFRLSPSALMAIGEICWRLDGIPLAIELAAARAKGLSVERIAERLDDRFRLLATPNPSVMPRQRTLHALVDWSYQLLDDSEQKLLARLSVFAGGWTTDAARKVCGQPDDTDDWEVDDLLSGLVDRSLVVMEVRPEGARYRMLETIRQFAAVRLNESQETQLMRGRHVQYYRCLASDLGSVLNGTDTARRMALLDVEVDNFRGALLFASNGNSENVADGMQLAYGLWMYWFMKSALAEGNQAIKRLLDHAGDAMRSELGARLLNVRANYLDRLGHVDEAIELAERALSLFVELGIEVGRITVTNSLGNLSISVGDYAAAIRYYDESIEHQKAAGNHRAEVLYKMNKSAALIFERRLDEARDLLDECIFRSRNMGDVQLLCSSLHFRGDVDICYGNLDSAGDRLLECRKLRLELGDRHGYSQCALGLADLAIYKGEFCKAEEQLAENLVLFRESANQVDEAMTLVSQGTLASKCGDLLTGSELCAQGCELMRNLNFRRISLGCMRWAAMILAERGSWQVAARVFGYVGSFREGMSDPLPPAEVARHWELRSRTAEAMGEETFEEMLRDGREMSMAECMDQVVRTLRGDAS